MFKKPIAVNHTIELKTPDLAEAAKPVLSELAQMMRTAGIALAIGIPCVILFGFAANVASEVAIDRLTD